MLSHPGKFVRASSLILAILLLFLFFRSYHHGDYLTFTAASTRRVLFSDCCSLRYQSFFNVSDTTGFEYTHILNPFSCYIDLAKTPASARVFGRFQIPQTGNFSLSLPYWPLVLPALFILLRFLRQSRRTYRRRLTLAFLLALWPFLIPLIFDISYDHTDLPTLIQLSLITLGLGWLLRRVPKLLARADAVIMIASLLNWRARRRRYRQKHGLCTECGFNLCATPYRCPECGVIATYWVGWALPVTFDQCVTRRQSK